MSSISRSFRLYVLILAALASFAAVPASAQYASGIEVTVTDPSGAAIPGATFLVTNRDTEVRQTATSDSQGYVRVLHLPPGKYQVEVKADGFRAWIQSDVLVEGDQTRTIYPKLTIGQQTTTVEVKTEPETVETTKGTISRTLEQKTVEESPLVGQNIYASVATLAPGVTGLGDASGSIAAAGSQGTNSFSSEAGFQINGAGQRQEANEFQVDGTTVNGNSRDGVVNITPEPDTVAEMKVSASTFSAEKGRQSGALIEIFTKSGTNQFHGSLSEMHTDNALMARTEFQTLVPHSVRNDFGGTFGGPLIKNHTFFFGSLFWMKSQLGSTINETVETKQFEDYVLQNFPNSIGAKFFAAAPPAAYPTSDFQTVGDVKANYFSSYPAPNIPDDLVATGRALINVSPRNDGFQGHFRIDHNFNGDKDKLFYSIFRNTTEGEHADARPAYAYINPNGTIYNKIGYLHAFSGSLLNEASVSYNRLTGSQPDKVPELPNAAWIGGLDATFWQWGPSGWVQNNWYGHDAVTYIHGAHSIHAGIDVDRLQDLDDFTNGEDRPYFLFLNALDFAADNPFSQSGPVLNVQTGGVAHNLYQRVMMLYVAPTLLERSLDTTSSNDNGVGGGQAVFDAQTLAGQYARSDYDSRHRFSADAVWSVPGFREGMGHALTSGWTLSPIVILQSGQPFTVYTSAPYSSGGDYNADGFNYDIPNTPSFGNHMSASRSDFLKGLFTPSDFPVPASGQEGSLGRNTYDGPGYASVNLAVQRAFALPMLGEAGRFEIRGEFLNLFNRVNLVGPVSDLYNSQFGMSTGQHAPRQIQLVAHLRF